MNLKRKVLFAVVLGIGALSAGIYLATDAIVMSGFLRQEHARADEGAKSTREIVGMMLDERLTRMVDWADWDDMAKFVEDSNPDFVESNIEANALASLQWDVLQVAHLEGGKDSLLVGLDPARQELVEVDPRLVEHLRNPATHLRQGEPLVGFVTVGDTLWVTASRQVHHTDKSAPKVPGRMITCSRINEAWLARLCKFSSLAVTLRRADQAPADAVEAAARRALAADPRRVSTLPITEEKLASFCWLDDLYGKPGVLVRIDSERPMLAQGRSILRSTMFTIAVGGVLMLGLTMFGVSRVLRRLGRLLTGVHSLRNGSATVVPVTVRDEIGELTTAFNGMAATIVDREQSLSAINGQMRLVLDNTGDGLLMCRVDGVVEGGVSRSALNWFGAGEGKPVWDYLFAGDDARRVEFQLGWQQFQDGFLPFELLVDQMPRRFERGEVHFEIDFRPIEQGGALAGLLLIVKDITARLEGERAEREARELQGIVATLLRDVADFERFLGEMQGLLERVVHTDDPDLQKRSLHTLKGNAAVYGFTGFAELCHRVEDALADGQAMALHARSLQERWQGDVQRIRNFLPERGTAQVVLSFDEYDRFVGRLHRVEAAQDLAQVAESWRYQPVASVFARLARQTQRVATTLGKQVRVETKDHSIRFEPEALAGFWESLVHVVRNAVDHGIEAPGQRQARGKPVEGRLLIVANLVGGDFVVTVTDDGAGIDWSAVRAMAKKRGLPSESHEDLVAALFADGLSTRAVVTEQSGRGVGLAAVREVCLALGGAVDVRSKPGVGTTFTFRMPKHSHSHALAVTSA